jgi:hypothetical protein
MGYGFGVIAITAGSRDFKSLQNARQREGEESALTDVATAIGESLTWGELKRREFELVVEGQAPVVLPKPRKMVSDD